MRVKMDTNVTVEITGSCEEREIKKVGDRLVPGDTTHHLVLRFPNGREHLARISHEAYNTYLVAVEAQMPAEKKYAEDMAEQLADQLAAAKSDPGYTLIIHQ